jgi:hypothetical protein
MASARQRKAARTNVKKVQTAWRTMSPPSRARAQPKGRKRAKPGTGGGNFYRVEVRPKDDFKTFRTQDVGEPGGIERLSGKRASGSWSTVTWLIGKEHAHREGDRLVADTKDARDILRTLGAEPRHVRGDRFAAKDRPNVPERKKPTSAQKTARRRNIEKAQSARRKR